MKKIERLAFRQLWTHLACSVLDESEEQKAMTRHFSDTRKTGLSFCIIALITSLVLAFPTDADAKTKHRTKRAKARPRAHRVAPVDSSTAFYADIVIEASTGRILDETSASSTRHPASLTKMMTLYLTFQAIESGAVRLDTRLTVSAKAARQSPTKLGLRAGQTIRVYDALMGLVTQSANDAAMVLAENLAGSEDRFVALMNLQSKALGMRGTVFQNPNGLPDPNQISTARDMALLGYGLIYHFPGFYPYFSRESFSYNGRTFKNHNHLMERYSGMDGIKTGYVRASGFNLVASVIHGSTRVIAVVFGGKTAARRDAQMESLLDDAFEKLAQNPTGEGAHVAAIPLPSKVAIAFSPTRAPFPKDEPPPRAFTQQRAAPEMSSEVTEGVGGWGIQVGAYSDVDSAQQALASMARSIPSSLGHAEQSLQKVTMTDGSAVYRARFTGLDQQEARDACSILIKRGQGCLVVTGP